MGYHIKRMLEKKLLEMYPELKNSDVYLSLRFDGERDIWTVGIRKGLHYKKTCIGKVDADRCLKGRDCAPLGVKIEKFLESLAY